MDREDQHLTGAIRTGNVKAFEQLFRKYRKKLIRFAYSYVYSIPVSEDLVQEVFLKVWQLRATLNPEDSIRAYLYQAVRNNALDYNKHKAVEERNLPEFRLFRDIHIKADEDFTEVREFEEAFHAAIEKLPDRAKEIYKLSRTDGLTYKEIADVTGISIKTVESQMSRSLKILRKALSDYLPALIIVELLDKVLM